MVSPETAAQCISWLSFNREICGVIGMLGANWGVTEADGETVTKGVGGYDRTLLVTYKQSSCHVMLVSSLALTH